MHVVAIRNLAGEPEERAPALAALLGESAYEARRRLIGDGPRVVATFANADDAAELASALDAVGFGGVALGGEGHVHVVPRSFVVRPDGIQATLRDGRPFAVRFDRIELLLRGTRIVQEERTEVTRERKFAPGRALLTGGLMLTKSVTKETRRDTEEREAFLLVCSRGVSDVLFLETELLYDGLGAAKAPTRAASFARLANLIRNHAGHARFDDRLLTRAGQVAVLGGVLDPEHHLDVATTVLASVLCDRGDSWAIDAVPPTLQ